MMAINASELIADSFARMAKVDKGELTERAALEERLQIVKDATKKDLRFTRYTAGGVVADVRCKVTGEFLSGMVETEGGERKVKHGNQTIIYRRVMNAYMADTKHLLIEFDDESAHTTLVSTSVINMLKGGSHDEQIALLEYLYMSDIDQWIDEESRGLGRVNSKLLAHRVPIGWKEEAF